MPTIDFTDAISENWGGRPFEDLQKGWAYILNKYPEVCRTVSSVIGDCLNFHNLMNEID